MNEFNPDYVSSPWETVLELDIVIDEHIARMLYTATGVPVRFWLNRERNYRDSKHDYGSQ